MTSNYEQDLVKITHYINPHMFWYKYEDTILNHVELSEWESRLNEHFANVRIPTLAHSTAKLNEIVAVFNFSLKRWIRAKCIEIVQFTIANTKYVMWAIDYGIPFQTEAKWINKIPSKLAEQPEETVFFGGISNVIPAEKEFNFETFESEIKTCKKWSKLAVRTIENLIYESAHIRFIRHLISKEGQFFGNLEFLTYTNQIIKADSSLVEINHAIRTTKFLRVIHQIKTNQIPEWKTNDGASFVSRFNINKISNIECLATVQPHYIDEEVSRKVSDWTKRNIQCQNDDKRSVIDDVASICESTISMKISRKNATDMLAVEKDECFREGNRMAASRKIVTEKLLALRDQCVEENDQENGENSETCQSIASLEQHDSMNEKDSSTEETIVNTVIDAPLKPKSDSPPNCGSQVVQNSDPTCNAMRLVIHRLNMKRKLMHSKKVQPKQPQNVIPAGFDMRNLQGSRTIVESVSDELYPSYLEKFRKITKY